MDDFYADVTNGEVAGKRKRASREPTRGPSPAEEECLGDIVYAFTRIPPLDWSDPRAIQVLKDEIRDWAGAHGITPTVRLARAAYAELGVEWRAKR